MPRPSTSKKIPTRKTTKTTKSTKRGKDHKNAMSGGSMEALKKFSQENLRKDPTKESLGFQILYSGAMIPQNLEESEKIEGFHEIIEETAHYAISDLQIQDNISSLVQGFAMINTDMSTFLQMCITRIEEQFSKIDGKNLNIKVGFRFPAGEDTRKQLLVTECLSLLKCSLGLHLKFAAQYNKICKLIEEAKKLLTSLGTHVAFLNSVLEKKGLGDRTVSFESILNEFKQIPKKP